MSAGKWIKRIRFRLKSAGYMRVAYLHPRQIAVVSTRFESKNNAMPLDWHIPLSFSPKLYAISLEKENHTQYMIRQSGCFVVNFMADKEEEKILALGKISGKETDKFTLLNIPKKESKKINCPILTESIGHLECKVKEIISTGDHDLIIGEVVYEDMDEKLYQRLYHITSSGIK